MQVTRSHSHTATRSPSGLITPPHRGVAAQPHSDAAAQSLSHRSSAVEVQPVPAEIIAVANHKGGVGKSFTAVSLAAGMAHAGWRTLLVDCDAQANATSMFDPGDEVQFDLLDIIIGGVEASKAVVTTRVSGLGLMGASMDVARLDQELI